MIPRPRRVSALLIVLLAAVVPFLGLGPAAGVGTGVPVIVTPADGETYLVDEVPDLQVDLDDAPYGTYAYALTGSAGGEVVSGDLVHQEETDPVAFVELPPLGLDEYTVTLRDSGDTVVATATFGTFDLGEPPVECTVDLPARVVAVAPFTAVYPTYDGCGTATATWDVDGPGTAPARTIGLSGGASRGPWRFRDSEAPGTYRALPQDAGPGLNLGTDTTVVKFGSRISLAAGTRSGTRVPLSGIVSRYSPAADAFRRWADRPVAVSYKDCAACPWRFLAMDRTDAFGGFTLTAVSRTARYYRATVGDTPTAWGSTSAPVRR